MLDLHITRHAQTRMDQRGLTEADIDLILAFGSEVEGGFVLRKKDVQAQLQQLRAQIQRIEKLEGKRVVVAKAHLVTAYHASSEDLKRLLRN